MLWPISGAEAGEGIIYKPQQYLDDELIFSDLFIAAPLGTAGVAPSDGTIDWLKSVFDDTVTERTPYGRGLLPDYVVPLTLEEHHVLPNDVILEKAIELIAEGKYLSDENPFAEICMTELLQLLRCQSVYCFTHNSLLFHTPCSRRDKGD